MDWWYSDDGDRRLQRKLQEEIDSAYASQAREASAIRSQVSALQGTLEQRIDRLAKAFDAFVELSDVRAELALFEQETSVRNAVQRLLRGLLRGQGLPQLPADLPQCRGYWLRPALEWLAAAISGDDSGSASALTEATELDEVRTAAFLTAALGLAGRPERAALLLRTALQSPGEQATYAQRALWNACAQGVYGDHGEALIRQWLAGYIRGMPASVITAERPRWAGDADRAFGPAAAARDLPGDLPLPLAREQSLITPFIAAFKLAAFRSWVFEAMTGEPAGLAGPGPASEAPPGAEPATDPRMVVLAAVAAALAEEGSPEEIALRRRARELREVVDTRKTVTRPSWDAPEEAVATLLRKDAFGTDVRARRLALGICAGWVSGAAAELAQAASAPPPAEFQVLIDWHAVRLTTSGQVTLTEANAEIAQSKAPQGVADRLFHRKQMEEEVAREQEQLARDAGQAADALTRRVSELRAAAAKAEADRAAIAELLTARF
jgi:hypothetical protein